MNSFVPNAQLGAPLTTTNSVLLNESVSVKSKGKKRAIDVLEEMEEDARQPRIVRFRMCVPGLEAPLLADAAASPEPACEIEKHSSFGGSDSALAPPAIVVDEDAASTPGTSRQSNKIGTSASNRKELRCLLPALDGSKTACTYPFAGKEKTTEAEIEAFYSHLKNHVDNVIFHKKWVGRPKPEEEQQVPCGLCVEKRPVFSIQYRSLFRHLKAHFKLQSWVCPNCGECISRDDREGRKRHKCKPGNMKKWKASQTK